MDRGWTGKKAFLRVNRREGKEWVDQDWDGFEDDERGLWEMNVKRWRQKAVNREAPERRRQRLSESRSVKHARWKRKNVLTWIPLGSPTLWGRTAQFRTVQTLRSVPQFSKLERMLMEAVNVKVKVTLEHAKKAQTGSRGIALLFL